MSKTNKIINISVAAVFAIILAVVSLYCEGKFAQFRKQQAQTALQIDSLERSLRRWELYSENLRRTLEQQPPVEIDSLLRSNSEEKDEKEQN